MSRIDLSHKRSSACPVHFVWDGRGIGRRWVRLGFMGFVFAGACLSSAKFFHSDQGWLIGIQLLKGAILLYAIGQILTGISMFQSKKRSY